MRSPGRRPAAVGSADTRERVRGVSRGKTRREGGRPGREGGPEAAGVQRPGEKEPQRQRSSEKDFEGCGWKGSGGKAQLPRPAPRAPRTVPRTQLPAPGQHWLLRAHGGHRDTNPERQMGTTPSRCAALLEFCGIPMS